jgi:hypothetical protein
LTRTNIDAKAQLNQNNYILIAKRITAAEIEKIQENIRFKIRDDTEDHTKEVNSNKMDTTVTEHQKVDQDINNTRFDKVENNKHPSDEEKQNTGIS